MKKVFLVLFLAPSIVMGQMREESFTLPCSKKIHYDVLLAAILTHVEKADLEHIECSGPITKNGILQADSSITEQTLIVTGVPQQYSRQQLQTFLQNHNVTETHYEQWQRAALEKRDTNLQQLPSYQDLLSRIEALEAAQ